MSILNEYVIKKMNHYTIIIATKDLSSIKKSQNFFKFIFFIQNENFNSYKKIFIKKIYCLFRLVPIGGFCKLKLFELSA